MPLFAHLRERLQNPASGFPLLTPLIAPLLSPNPTPVNPTVPLVINPVTPVAPTPNTQPANHPLIQAALTELASLFSASPTAGTPVGGNILSVLQSAISSPTTISLIDSVFNSSTATGQPATSESVINEIGLLFEQLMGQPTNPTTGS